MGRYTRQPQTDTDRQVLQTAFDAFNNTEAAKTADREPLPPGDYIADVSPPGCFPYRNNRGTEAYKMQFVVAEGEHAGRLLFADFYLTRAALPYTKSELKNVGITRGEQLNEPLPNGIRVRLRVTRETADSGAVYNSVRHILECVSFTPPAPDVFAPADPSQPQPAEPTGPQPTGPAGDSQTELPF